MKEITIDGITYELVKKEPIYDDWRLPTYDELLSIVNLCKVAPSCDLEDTALDYYYASDAPEKCFENFYRWIIDFEYGRSEVGCVSTLYYVRCVRDGKNGLEWSKTAKKRMRFDEAKYYAENLKKETYYIAK